jgi:hypothetical protein
MMIYKNNSDFFETNMDFFELWGIRNLSASLSPDFTHIHSWPLDIDINQKVNYLISSVV